MPVLVVPTIVCCFLEDVEGVAVCVFRPFDEEADRLKDFLFLPYSGGEFLSGLVIEGPGSWRGWYNESL